MKALTLFARGFAIWLIPLVISFFFYTPESELIVSYPVFKSVMIVTLTAVTFAVSYFWPARTVSPVVTALLYTAISLILDLLVLVPFIRMPLSAYFEQIAFTYIIIPTLTWALLTRQPGRPVQKAA